MDMHGKCSTGFAYEPSNNSQIAETGEILAKNLGYPYFDCEPYILKYPSIHIIVPVNPGYIQDGYYKEHTNFLQVSSMFALGCAECSTLLLTEKGFYLESFGTYHFLGLYWKDADTNLTNLGKVPSFQSDKGKRFSEHILEIEQKLLKTPNNSGDYTFTFASFAER
eukprot:TRINITY_DN6547_c0_g1_i3.p1 TRINITY_DN6547_c0_g1~~TRINITY_DN6547_c0_g1_i3.p1  ORF type:complete len:166 (-),score=4.65 TRINITY_DN6547_c0_g1_i3:130-627(-)